MPETKIQKLPHRFLLSYYITIASLIVLIDKSHLTHTVKKHCKTALKAIGIIYGNQSHNTGIHALYTKEFDVFFKSFPPAYFNNRGLISVDLMVKSIKLCMATNDVVHIAGE